MHTDDQDSHQQIRQLVLENQRLLNENNQLLKKIHRNAVITFWVRIVWLMMVVGLPFVVYYFVVEPYFEALGSSFETFRAGLQEIPGWKQFYDAVQGQKPMGGQ